MRRFLLIDDDEINNFITIKLIHKTLRDAEISTCLNGRDGIDFLMKLLTNDPLKFPDCILLDLNMPVMNGWDFLDEYSRLQTGPAGKCPVYIVTSSIFTNDMDRARTYPVVAGFVSKPLHPDKIRQLSRLQKLA